MTLQGSAAGDGPGLITEEQARRLSARVLAMATAVDDALVTITSG